jgi:hypothetical protein
MAELKRKDEELTTADLAGTNTKPEIDRGPKLVRDENRFGAENAAINNETAAREDAFNNAENRIGERPNVAQNAAPAALFNDNEVGEFRNRWNNIQTGFVDEPRKAVEDADNLVASLMKKLAEGFANERANLEKQWDRGDSISTEDLRVALQRYRSFFDRLLKV